jgi:heme oxygenase
MVETTMSARFALRAATADAHHRLDKLFSRFDLGQAAGYADFLLAQTGALLGAEAALDASNAKAVLPDWPERRRAKLLIDDLAVLGLAAPSPTPVAPFATEAAVLGAIYVLEGSRLGGAVLVRSVPDGLPRRFLSPGNPTNWRAFVALLDQRLSSRNSIDQASAAARAVFDAFDRSARPILGPDGLQ